MWRVDRFKVPKTHLRRRKGDMSEILVELYESVNMNKNIGGADLH